ncbi:MAG TPA: 2-oxoacid:acceptor oxidoreductase family protein, partial [bacterium]|nr:2-oxoacid:acceptor oxidoreductase family protein [bacterium]
MCRIILGGTGGQGVITLGKLLAIAGMNEGFNVSCYPIYGAEMRGGYAFSTVILAREEVPSPIISRAELGIFLDPLAFDYLAGMVGRRGMLVINSEQVAVACRRDRRIVPAEALSAAR